MSDEPLAPYAVTVQMPTKGIRTFRFWNEGDAQHCMNGARQLGYPILDATCDQQLLPPTMSEEEYQMHVRNAAPYNGGEAPQTSRMN